jgi:hypothetical protein
MPKHWFDDHPHTHIALDDAIEQGALFCNMLADLRVWQKNAPPIGKADESEARSHEQDEIGQNDAESPPN